VIGSRYQLRVVGFVLPTLTGAGFVMIAADARRYAQWRVLSI